jgi:hypothetical protein
MNQNHTKYKFSPRNRSWEHRTNAFRDGSFFAKLLAKEA